MVHFSQVKNFKKFCILHSITNSISESWHKATAVWILCG